MFTVQYNESAPARTKFEIGVKDLELQRWETLLTEYRDRCAIVNARRLLRRRTCLNLQPQNHAQASRGDTRNPRIGLRKRSKRRL
jgi:hypothetical protein